MKRVAILCLAGASCALVALLVALKVADSPDGEAQSPDSSEAARSRSYISEPAIRRQPAVRGGVARRAKPVLDFGDGDDDADDDSRTPAERSLAERIEKALDEEDLKAALACADEAQRFGVADIRQAMIDTLGWFGGNALPELVPFLADPDDDVRESARGYMTMSLSDMENDADRIGVVESVMKVLDDEDFLEEVSGEYIGIDEKLAVESIMRIISADGSPNGVAKAKEAYEFVTGDEWTDAAAAARWIAEEYEPPEAL